jgi:hypothetical protein
MSHGRRLYVAVPSLYRCLEVTTMSTPEQWELGGEIMDRGVEHASLAIVLESWNSVMASLAEAQKASKGLKRIGVGRTEDPTLIVARVVPSLRELAETASLVAKQLEDRLGGFVRGS